MYIYVADKGVQDYRKLLETWTRIRSCSFATTFKNKVRNIPLFTRSIMLRCQ